MTSCTRGLAVVVIMAALCPARGAMAANDGEWSVGFSPTGRTDHTAIYDAVRGRMVIFGGYQAAAPNHLNDVWVFRPGHNPEWTEIVPAGTPPSPRRNHSAIYDPVRDRMVVFGGFSGTSPAYRNDVWALSLGDDPTWTQLAPSGASPTPRRGQSAVYDPIRDRMVVCGGFSSVAPAYRNDVWTLSLGGTPTWTEIAPTGTPPAGRTEHTAIYDPVRDRMVIYAGTNGAYRNDVWTLSLGGTPAWSEITPAGTPPTARSEHAAIFDPVHDWMVVFGETNENLTLLNEVWALSLASPATWTEIVPSGVRAAGRWGHSAIYDPVGQRMVVFGGYPNYANDLWSFSLGGSPAWAELAPLETVPSGRWFQATVYDPIRDRIIVCGGYPMNGFDVWTYNLGGVPSWTRIHPTGTPPSGRKNHTAIYDPVRDRVIIFAGFLTYPDDPLLDLALNDVWALSLDGAPHWTELIPSGTPPSRRFGHTAIYDPLRDRMLVFSGYGTFASDVWALSLGPSPAWTQISPSGTPPEGRYRHSAVYDPLRDRMIVFAGYKGDYSCVNDTWELTLGGTPVWTQLAPVGTPPSPRGRHSAVYDPLRDRMIVFGAYDCDYDYLNDTWELALHGSTAWTSLSPSGTLPVGRSGHSAVYDPLRDRMVIFGGGGPYVLNDVWSLTWGAPSCAVPRIDAYSPAVLNPSNCSDGCAVSFTVNTEGDYSGVASLRLERYREGLWVPEDSVSAPIPAPPWVLACKIDQHYTDGPHVFRAAFHCADGSRGFSETAVVMSDRGVPVAFQSIEASAAGLGVAIVWRLASEGIFEGFNIYRSPSVADEFERINTTLVASAPGRARHEYFDGNAKPGNTYRYRVGAVDAEGEWLSQIVSVTLPAVGLALHQNIPNPFNPATSITFDLPERSWVTLAVYDVGGRHVTTLLDGIVEGGRRDVVWNGDDARGLPVSSGIYFCRLRVEDRTLVRRMVFIK